MLKRLATSLIGIIVFFGVIFSHHYVLYGAVTLITLGMIYEMNKMTDTKKVLSFVNLFVGLLICFGSAVNVKYFALIIALMIYGFMVIILHGKETSKDLLASAFVTVFMALFMGTLITIRKIDRFIVILPFVCAWMSDSGAFLIGSCLGRHKLCEKISPKKTVEGAVAGLIFAVIGSILYITIMTGFEPNMRAYLTFGIIGFIGGILSQFGDFIFSCIKRDWGKKDYGSILPGHGGILDRFDSVVFILPYIYYMIIYFIR